RDDMLVVGDDVVEVEGNVLQHLRISGNRPQRGLLALEVAAEDAAARMPGEVIAPGIAQRFQIAALERRKRIANHLDLLVEAELRAGFRHHRPPLSPFGLDPARAGMTAPGSDYRLAARAVNTSSPACGWEKRKTAGESPAVFLWL